MGDRARDHRGVVSRRRGLWHYRGHGGDPIPGELNELAPHRDSDYLVSRYLDWFDRHLKDESVAPAPEFSWFRDWISYEGNSEPAYATAPDLDAAAVLTGLPLGPGAHSVRSGPDANPEDAAAWTSEPLTSDLVQVGAPQVTLNVSGASAATAADAAVLFVTVYDLAPDGTATRVGNSVPTRVSSDTTVEVTVPAAVHRFEPGHRVQVTVAGGQPMVSAADWCHARYPSPSRASDYQSLATRTEQPARRWPTRCQVGVRWVSVGPAAIDTTFTPQEEF